ncbi:hypothetical protein KY338_06625 [Candidatus Woesearchaeota archaeon]|nr:hypothetical protein [Candidatus Woesearchaeota archaeon]MBW3006399.1 hypothetical protein [Candidatus Woesearchaeota archaeon]
MYEQDENGTIYDPDKEVTGEQIGEALNERIASFKKTVKETGIFDNLRGRLLGAAAGALMLSLIPISKGIQNYQRNISCQRMQEYRLALRDIYHGNTTEGRKALERLADNWTLESFITAGVEDGTSELAQNALDRLEKGD